MKNTLTIIGFLCLTAGTARAQMWTSEGQKWLFHYGPDMGGSVADILLKIEGDTVWQGKNYKKQKKYRILTTAVPPPSGDTFYISGIRLIRESNDSVFIVDDQQEVLLFNFNQTVGDTLWIEPESCAEWMVLDSVKLIDTFGTVRRQQYWDVHGIPLCFPDPIYAQLRILEGVGVVYFSRADGWGDSAPFDYRDALKFMCECDATYERLECFHNADDLSATDTCYFPEFLVSEVEHSTLQQFQISPNPTTSTAVIQWQQAVSGALTVIDLTGRVLTQQKLQNTTSHTLDCAAWPTGVYVVRLQAETGKQQLSKLIIQH